MHTFYTISNASIEERQYKKDRKKGEKNVTKPIYVG